MCFMFDCWCTSEHAQNSGEANAKRAIVVDNAAHSICILQDAYTKHETLTFVACLTALSAIPRAHRPTDAALSAVSTVASLGHEDFLNSRMRTSAKFKMLSAVLSCGKKQNCFFT